MGDIWGALGIAVSIGLFLTGYRQTIGARKERVASANQEVEKILVRRIVLEGYTPTIDALGRLLEGKARDFRVRPTDLLSEEQVMNGIFTRILESDLIPHDKREEILERLLPVMSEAEREPFTEAAVQLKPAWRSLSLTTTAMGLMGAAASVVGALVTALPSLANLDTDYPQLFSVMMVTAAISVTLISGLIAYYRLRESQQYLASKGQAMAVALNFERDVANALAKAGAQVRASPARDAGYDFVVEQDGRKVLVEVKAWTRPMPIRLVAQLADQLRHLLAREGAAEAIIVTPSSVNIPEETLGGGVRIMTLSDLQRYLLRGRGR